MSSYTVSNFIILVLIQLQLVLSDYDCLCYYGIEKQVYDNALHSSLVGYLYEFDCKPLEDRDADGHFGVAFDHKLGYIVKDDGDLQIQVCPGAPPAADSLIRTTSPIVTSSFTVTQNTVVSIESVSSGSSLTNTRFQTSKTQHTSHLSSILSSVPTSYVQETTSLSTGSNLTRSTMVAPSVFTTIQQGESKTASIVISSSESPKSASAYTISASSNTFDNEGHTNSYLTSTNIYELSTKSTVDRTSFKETKSTQPFDTKTFSSLVTTISEHILIGNIDSTSISQTENRTTVSTNQSIDTIKTSSSAYENNQNLTGELTVSPKTGETQPPETTSASILLTTIREPIFIANANITHVPVTDNPTSVPIGESSHQTTINVGQNSSSGMMTFPDICFYETTTSNTSDTAITGHVDLCPYKFLAESMYVNGTYPFFRQNGHFCYELRNGSKTWNEAERDCHRRGGSLVSINTYSTFTLLEVFIQKMQPSYDYWIGLTNSHSSWEWSNGDKFECSLTWSVEGTTCNNNPQCVVMSSLDGSWAKSKCSPCGEMASWICQYRID
ncbi:uncharacterized protein LOC127842427 [Dreissena polymorpha]|uniref:C-type lectin domain-containing protein n=1 Tax=Dreissena polymorpha TaxID=45954 RepID=A0A9D4EP61_DREPO|nr:uncharacterized protein LOC127842427 [Dreissena polymorpha]KAH3783655.1 hypothetical protein DPMN_161598 [Dreissena polymorpha]